MEKPWDKLRSCKKPPLESGDWETEYFGAKIDFHFTSVGRVDVTIAEQTFSARDLYQLAEFCAELAVQLEGK